MDICRELRRWGGAVVNYTSRSPRRKLSFSLLRLMLTVTIICATLTCVPPDDGYSAATAAALAFGLGGLTLFSARRDIARIAFETAVAVAVAWAFFVLHFPVPNAGRDGDWVRDVDLPNARQGLIVGWLGACVIVRLRALRLRPGRNGK